MSGIDVHALLKIERGAVRRFGQCCMFAGGSILYLAVGEMPRLVGRALAPFRTSVQVLAIPAWMCVAGALVAICVSMIRTGQLICDASAGLVNGGNDRRTGAWPVAATITMPTIRADGVVVRHASVAFH